MLERDGQLMLNIILNRKEGQRAKTEIIRVKQLAWRVLSSSLTLFVNFREINLLVKDFTLCTVAVILFHETIFT